MILRVSDDTTTITLDDPLLVTPIYRIVNYTPVTPSIRSVTIANQGDGSRISDVQYEDVSETVSIVLNETSMAAAQAVVNAINLLFERARAGVAVVAQYAPDDDVLWTSPIKYGRASLGEDTHSPWALPKGHIEIAIEWTRGYAWEGGETLATVTSAAGSGVTAAITNRDDGTASQGHWLTVASSQIGGDLPAKVRLELRNTYASGTGTFYVGRSAYAATNGQRLVLEGENAAGSGSNQSDSTASNGSVRRSGVMPSTLQPWLTWTLSSALLAALAGRTYKILARLVGSIPAGTWVSVQVLVEGVTPIAVTPPIRLATGRALQEIAAVPLPPISVRAAARPLTLQLMHRNESGAGTIDLDCLYLLPTESYRILRNRGFAVAQNAYVGDEGDIVYSRGYSPDASARMTNYVGDGPPITLTPGVTNTLYILAENATGGMERDRSTSVQVYVTPRRLTI